MSITWPVDLLKRQEKGSPLTVSDHDNNMTTIEDALNDLYANQETTFIVDDNPTFDASVENGDLVYKANDGIYYPALADGTEKANVVGIAGTNTNVVVSQGFITTSYTFSANTFIYLSDTDAGKLTDNPTTVPIGISLGNGVILIAGRGGASVGTGLPYITNLTLTIPFTIPDGYGAIVPDRYEIVGNGQLIIEGSGVFMIVDNE